LQQSLSVIESRSPQGNLLLATIFRDYIHSISNLLRKVASSQSLSKPITTNYIIFNPPGAGHKGNGSGSLISIRYPDQNVDVPTGTLIAVGGTSAPSNATLTNCNVAVQINQHGFVQASPHDSKITIPEPA